VVAGHALLEVGVRRDPDEGDGDLVAIPCGRSPVSVAVEIPAPNRPLLEPHESTGMRTLTALSRSELDAALSGEHEHRAASAVELVAHLSGDDHMTFRRAGL
jgi:hypothetical protein